MQRGLFPEPATDAPKQKRVFAVIVIGLVGILLLGLVGIGGLVLLRGGVEEGQTNWASRTEVVRGNLGPVGDSLLGPYGTASPALLMLTIVGSGLVAAVVGCIIAGASGRSTRKRVDSLESRFKEAAVELDSLRTGNQRRIDSLSQDLQMLRDDRMHVPDGSISSSLRGWMEAVDRSQKKLDRDVRTLYLAFGKQRKGDDG